MFTWFYKAIKGLRFRCNVDDSSTGMFICLRALGSEVLKFATRTYSGLS